MIAMQQLRIAVAGAAAIGRRHIDLILQSRYCKLAAIIDPAPGSAASKAGIPPFSSLTDLFAHERPTKRAMELRLRNVVDCEHDRRGRGEEAGLLHRSS